VSTKLRVQELKARSGKKLVAPDGTPMTQRTALLAIEKIVKPANMREVRQWDRIFTAGEGVANGVLEMDDADYEFLMAKLEPLNLELFTVHAEKVEEAFKDVVEDEPEEGD
jgi:hypothetical protein